MPDGLRPVPDDAEQMASAVAWLEARAAEAEPTCRVGLLSRAGAYALVCRDLERAHGLLEEAVALADSLGIERQAIVARIRLADTMALDGEGTEAAQVLEGLLVERGTLCHEHGLVDFVHQHLGKALFEAGDIAGAREHLGEALRLRRERGAAELTRSTEAALAAVERAAAG